MGAITTTTSGQGSLHESRNTFVSSRIRSFFAITSGPRKKSRDNVLHTTDSMKLSEPSCAENVGSKKESRFGLSTKRVFSNSYDDIPVSPARLSVRFDNQLPSFQGNAARLASSEPASVQPRVFVNTIYDSEPSTARSACCTALNIAEILECILLNLVDLGDSVVVGKASTDKVEWPKHGSLYNCLTVNTVFYGTAVRLISRRVSLCSIEQVQAYTATSASKDNLCRDLLIHRVKSCQQAQFQQISQFRLKTLELYVCPKLVPTESMLSSGTLRKLALPGCALVDGPLIRLVARLCPALQILDLRACELVCDESILAIAQSCKALSYLNVGRVNSAEAITDRSIVEICKNTAVETLGLAGCNISDETVLAIANYRGSRIERLSMNQCHRVSDLSICQLLRSAPRLQVLEIVGCERTKDAKTLCYFKISTGALVETSEVFALEMQLYEREVRHELERLKHRLLKSQRRVTT